MMKVTKKLLCIILVVTICISNFLVGNASVTNELQIPEDAIEFNGHYYKLFDDSITWSKAKEYCESIGGHLVTVNTQAEQDFLINLSESSKKKNLWIGAKSDNSGNYSWVTGEVFSFTNWATGEPNNVHNSQFTAMMYTHNASVHAGLWNDENENGRDWSGYYLSDFGFICEWDDISIEQYPDGYDFDWDRYSFSNLDETISENIYKKAYGSVKGWWLHLLYEDGDTHGHCYGMSSTTAALLKYPNAINQFESCYTEDYYVSNLMEVYPEYANDLFGVDARTYIKYGYVYQFDNDVQKNEKASQNNVNGLYSAVEKYVNGTGDPVIINVYHTNFLGRKDGHSVFAIGTLEEDGKQYILINDSNIPYEVQKMEVNTDSSAWEYNVDSVYNYSSENGVFTYSFPADVIYNVGLLLNSNYSEFLSSSNNLVSSTSDIFSDCALEEILPATAGTDETDSSTKLYWTEKTAEEIKITAQEENSTVTVSDNNSSVTVEIDTSDSANFFVDDDSNNSVVLNCTDEENVDISFKTANCSGDEVEIVVSATANDDNVTASLTDNGISISGVSNGDVSVIKYDEIIETKTITEGEVEIETELPNAGHNFVDGVCTECGERTIVIDEMSSQIRFDRNNDGSYAEKFDIRTRAMISDETFTELVGATNEEAANNIDKIGFVYTLDGENFSANSAQAVAQGEKVAGYIDKPVKYIQDADGYYMFTCLVTDIPETDKNYTLTAYAYICVNGKWYFGEEPMNADFNSLHSTYYPIACEKYGWEM